MIVSLFEIGKDEGDVAGEFQLWKARRGLTQRIPSRSRSTTSTTIPRRRCSAW
ncbi:hypothetical protein ACFSLT_00600 [Novosphingobium resinovorum]